MNAYKAIATRITSAEERFINYAMETADELPFMTTATHESCPHEDFTENLTGRTCGLETK